MGGPEFNSPAGCMDSTTIQVSRDTKELLDDHKQQQESYNDVVRRLAGASNGQLWTEAELREMIKEEVERMAR